jgi:hypothetical protein
VLLSCVVEVDEAIASINEGPSTVVLLEDRAIGLCAARRHTETAPATHNLPVSV